MISLLVNGSAYRGWKTARVTRGIEAIAGSFDLSVSDRWNGQDQIAEEAQCAVQVDDTTLITGFVDKRSVSYSASDHSLSVSGRDATGALVDCSCVLSQWEFNSVNVVGLIKKLIAPYSILLTVDPSVGTIPAPPTKFSINPGESVFEAIDRLCKLAGVLPVSDGNGGLLLTRAGTASASDQLIEGQNILEASAEYDAAGRFATYIVSGQKRGTDSDYGLGAANVKASATDSQVQRSSRTLLIRPSGAVTLAYARTRAQWEAAVRLARASTITITVQGWTQSNGDLWPINALVNVVSPRLGVKGNMLITQTVMSMDTGGEITRITCRSPKAFFPEPAVTKAAEYWKEIVHGV